MITPTAGRRPSAVLSLVILSTAGTTAADSFESKVMVIRHRPSAVSVSGEWAPKLVFSGTNDFTLRPREKVYFTLVRTPLLFDYSVSPTVVTLTADARAVDAFVNHLVPFTTPVDGAPAIEATNPNAPQRRYCPISTGVRVVKDGFDREICALGEFRLDNKEAFKNLMAEFASLPDLIVRTARGGDVKDEPAARSGTPAVVRSAIRAVDALAKECSAFGSELIPATLGDKSSVDGEDENAMIRSTLSCAPGALEAPKVLATLRSITEIAARATDMLTVLDAFRKDLASTGEVQVVDDQNAPRYVAYDAQRDQRVGFTFRRTKRYDALLSKDQISAIDEAIKDQVGNFVLEFHPKNLVRYRAAGGVVYSMVTRATFDTVKRGDDLFVRANVSGSSNFAAAFMLNVIPVAASDPSFEPYLQLGLGPKKDDVAFYLGAGMTAFSKFSFGLGLAVEKTEALTNGIYAGAKISDPALLKDAVYKRFRPGLYFQVSVTP